MKLLKEELYRSFLFFYKEANHNLSSNGYGLILDNSKRKSKASIASVGFGLSSYVIGVENKFITYEEGKELVINTFKTFLNNVETFHGFFYHFLDINTAKQYKKCEVSTIDTVIFFNGAITCDSYFDEPEVHQLFNQLFKKLDFLPFITTYEGKKVFRMAYNPNKGGDYRSHTDDPWIYQWHMYAEQLSMYFIAAATDNLSAENAKELYNDFIRYQGEYKHFKYIYCPTNALFVYQYSHAWLDFRNLVDSSGVNWFNNSKIATLANREYCIDHQKEYQILNENAWGLTACLTPKGYRNQCIEPNNFNDDEQHVFGVLPPSGALGSLPFTSDEVLEVVKELESKYMDAFKEYGFTDGIALEKDKLWISDEYIGINKGITVLMIDNYLNGTTWKYYMKHPLIQKAIKKLSFKEVR
ncbi:glucoamylase family protein [Mycoplasmatota bacterium WC30]